MSYLPSTNVIMHLLSGFWRAEIITIIATTYVFENFKPLLAVEFLGLLKFYNWELKPKVQNKK